MVQLLLAAALVPQTPLSVDTIQPERGPTVLIHRQASPLVALRLSAPAPVALPEGSAELLQELARPEAQAEARRFGARLDLRHEDGRSIIAVTGPATAFDALVAILRRATGEPDLSVSALRRARARTEDRVLARLEQPGPRIRRLLRHAVYGGPVPWGAAATGLDPESVRGLRARVYDPARTRVVLVGSIPEAVIRSAFSRWPAAGGGPVAVGDTTARARPQAHREWGGLAFPVDSDPAVLAVTAELVQERLGRTRLLYGSVEAWHGPAAALALIGAAAPDDSVVRATAGISALPVQGDSVSAPPVGRYLRRLVAEAAALAGPRAVVEARAAVRRRLLVEARTAAGKAEVIGRITDDLAGAITPESLLLRLEAVDRTAVRSLLARILETPALVAEAR